MNYLYTTVLITYAVLFLSLPVTDLLAQNSSHFPVSADNKIQYLFSDDLNIEKSNPDQSGFFNSLTRGKIVFNNRLRSELAQSKQLSDALAITNRLQLGYATRPWYGVSGFADFVDVRPIGPDRYNAAGLNNRPNHVLIADPRLTVLNQLYGKFSEDSFDLLVRIGRQRIVHGNARFIGNVGWRQNEQTYDAATVNTSFGIENLKLQYSYVWQVNRVIGPDHPFGIYSSDFHLTHLSYTNLIPRSTLTAFFYYLDFEDFPALSAQTVGFRMNGSIGLTDYISVNYAGSYSIQESLNVNPLDYSNNYYLVNLSAELHNFGEAGAALETFTGDQTAAFETPLATLHAFQGWTDTFLTMPIGGLRDFNIYASSRLSEMHTLLVRHHWFQREDTGERIGTEINASISMRVNKNLSFLVKYAEFFGEETLRDTRKFWLQMEFGF